MLLSIFWKPRILTVVLLFLFLLLVLTIGSPNFSLFNKLIKTSDQSSFSELELRLPDVALAQSLGITVCELDYQNINQIEIKDYKKAIRGLNFLQKELNKNFQQDSLQSLVTKILANDYSFSEKDNLCLPPLIISANAGAIVDGKTKTLTLASQKLNCNGEAYLDNKYKVTDSLVKYSEYLKDNKTVRRLNKKLSKLQLIQKELTAPKQITTINKNILRTTLARDTARFYLKHSDKLVTFYESLCLQAPPQEDLEEEPENTVIPEDPIDPSPSVTPPNDNNCKGASSQPCTIANGIGIQTRTCNNGVWNSYGNCALQSCNSGYQVSGNSCLSTVTSPFTKGDKVELIKNTNFRKSPALSGVLIQQLPIGTVGTITGDTPLKNSTDNVTWRQVDFGLGQVSYAGEDNFKIHAPPLSCENGDTQQRKLFRDLQVEESGSCEFENQIWTCVNNEWKRTTGTFLYSNCSVSSGKVPNEVPSYGPNGTHWPNLIETPFLYTPSPHDITVDCSWEAIKNAISKLSDSQVADGVRILIKPGTLIGQGAGLDTISVLNDLGKSAWSKRVLVTPKDGYGTVTISGGFKFKNIQNIAFAGFYGTAGFYCIDCNQSALAWTRLNGYSAIHAERSHTTTSKFELSEVSWITTKVATGDVLQLISNAGYLKDFKFQGLWMPPHYYEKDFLKKYPNKNDIPHMDTLQIYRVNGGTYQGINLSIKDSVIFASNNAAFQTGGTDGILLDHSLIIGGSLSTNRYPPTPIGGEDTSLFPAMNGQGSNWEVHNSSIYGALRITQGDFSPQPFYKVSNSRMNENLISILTPKSGSWIIDKTVSNYSNKLRPNITDDDLRKIWVKK